MKRGKSILEHLMHTGKLGTQPLPTLPLVELSGTHRLLIENHSGITEYGRDEICVKVQYGHLRITGSSLELARMAKDQLVITGNIEVLSLDRERA